MAYKRKTWAQKWAEAVAKPDLPKIWECPQASERFVVPNPAEVEEIVRRVPKGQVVTLSDIGKELAAKHGTATCCPMTTGIFAWILAHAAVEDQATGMAAVPWWRVVKTKGELNAKYPGAPDLQKSLLEAEGRTVSQKGQRLFVEGVA